MGRRDPRHISEIVALGRRGVVPPTRLAALQGSWKEIVGPEVAGNCTPIADHDGVIDVQCTASVWVRELSLLKANILARVVDKKAFDWVLDLRFKLPE